MYFVYYQDGCDGPDTGLAKFEVEASAIAFIENRLLKCDRGFGGGRDISMYTVVKGEKLHVSEVESVTRVRFDPEPVKDRHGKGI